MTVGFVPTTGVLSLFSAVPGGVLFTLRGRGRGGSFVLPSDLPLYGRATLCYPCS